MAAKPLWRRAFDAAERAVGVPLETVVSTDMFADGLAVAAHLRRRVVRGLEDVTARGLHLWNLPTHSDLRRVSQQVQRLERDLRELSRLAAEAERLAARAERPARRKRPH